LSGWHANLLTLQRPQKNCVIFRSTGRDALSGAFLLTCLTKPRTFARVGLFLSGWVDERAAERGGGQKSRHKAGIMASHLP